MKLDKRRRIENKTNYKKRLLLLKGKSPRLVFRKTNRYIILQIIESKDAHDKVLFTVNSKDLIKLGFPKENLGTLKSVPAAYLSGYLIGKKAKGFKGRLILDTGLIPNTPGSKVYAATKGVLDSGIEIKIDKKVIPSEDRITGKDTKLDSKIFNKIKEAIK